MFTLTRDCLRDSDLADSRALSTSSNTASKARENHVIEQRHAAASVRE